MGQVLHGCATTTYAVRAAIQRSKATIAELAEKHGVNPKTVMKWRGRESVEDLPMGPKEPRSTVLSSEYEAPSLSLHEILKSIGGAKASKAAIARLRSMIAASRPTARDARSELLIEILIADDRYEEAWVILRERGAGGRLTLELAEKSEKTHPTEVIAVYWQHIESLVRTGDNRSYEEAARYIAQLAKLQTAAAHAALIGDLRTRHRAKRNFVKLLG